MAKCVDDDPGTARLLSVLLRMHRDGQSHQQISNALDVSEAFVSATIEKNRANWLDEMVSVFNAARNFVQHRRAK